MGHGIHRDLYARMDKAFERGLCVTPTSKSDAERLRRALQAGVVVSPRPTCYVLPEAWASLNRRKREVYIIRTLAAKHPTWVFSGISAAVIHGLEVSYPLLGNIHLATPQSSHVKNHGGLIRHRMESVPSTVVDGIRVTSLERTAFDCLRSVNFRFGLAIADSVLRVSNEGPEHFIEAFNSLHKRNVGHQRTIDIMSLADDRAENGGESVARAVIIEQGFMPPDLQREMPDPINQGDTFRVDFYWELPGGAVIGELDGHEKYHNPDMTHGRDIVEVFADERLRESHLSGTGNRIARFSYKQVTDTRYFCHLLACYGIPSGYAVPSVANPHDPVNW